MSSGKNRCFQLSRYFVAWSFLSAAKTAVLLCRVRLCSSRSSEFQHFAILNQIILLQDSKGNSLVESKWKEPARSLVEINRNGRRRRTRKTVSPCRIGSRQITGIFSYVSNRTFSAHFSLIIQEFIFWVISRVAVFLVIVVARDSLGRAIRLILILVAIFIIIQKNLLKTP